MPGEEEVHQSHFAKEAAADATAATCPTLAWSLRSTLLSSRGLFRVTTAGCVISSLGHTHTRGVWYNVMCCVCVVGDLHAKSYSRLTPLRNETAL